MRRRVRIPPTHISLPLLTKSQVLLLIDCSNVYTIDRFIIINSISPTFKNLLILASINKNNIQQKDTTTSSKGSVLESGRLIY